MPLSRRPAPDWLFGLRFVHIAKQDQPDVVLLDIVMPVKEGIAAAYEIGQIAQDTKIFISSHYTPETGLSILQQAFGEFGAAGHRECPRPH
jgi:chemotaxis response regulator CheB